MPFSELWFYGEVILVIAFTSTVGSSSSKPVLENIGNEDGATCR